MDLTFSVVLASIDFALVGLLFVAWRSGRAEDRRRQEAMRREVLEWLRETKIEDGRELPSWMVEP